MIKKKSFVIEYEEGEDKKNLICDYLNDSIHIGKHVHSTVKYEMSQSSNWIIWMLCTGKCRDSARDTFAPTNYLKKS